MPEGMNEYEAMVVPRGARIISGENGNIELDVDGDLILQESQRGLTALVSHHGSILIDEGVSVKSHSIKARHLIRVRGKLETGEIRAANISLEGGVLRCEDVTTGALTSSDSELEVRSIGASTVRISGGTVEIGAINSKKLKLENRVRGAILISNAEDRQFDETVQVKGGFESDVELLGYLLKYRRQVMSDRVLNELKSRKEGREFQRFLLRQEEPNGERQARPFAETAQASTGFSTNGLPEVVIEDEPEREEQPSPPPVEMPDGVRMPVEMPGDIEEAVPRAVADRFEGYAEELVEALGDVESAPMVVRSILTKLRNADLHGLRTTFTDWSDELESERGALSVRTLEVLDDINDFVGSLGD